MSAFEFIFTANTLILALVIARLLEGLRDAFDRRRRYWIHYLWVVNRIMVVYAALLMAFAVRDRTDLSAHDILIIITPTAILFLQINVLISSQPADIESWRDHFWRIKKWFFGANMLYILGVAFVTSSAPGATLTIFERYAAVTLGLALSLVGYISSNERVHGLLVVVGVLNMVFALVRLVFLG